MLPSAPVQRLLAGLETPSHPPVRPPARPSNPPPLPTHKPSRLGERFGEHAQFGKQRALQLLRRRLLGLRLESTQIELQHRLLAFLYAASRAPLSTQYAGGALVEGLEEQVGAGRGGRRVVRQPFGSAVRE